MFLELAGTPGCTVGQIPTRKAQLIRRDALLENLVIDDNGKVDFKSAAKTENVTAILAQEIMGDLCSSCISTKRGLDYDPRQRRNASTFLQVRRLGVHCAIVHGPGGVHWGQSP